MTLIKSAANDIIGILSFVFIAWAMVYLWKKKESDDSYAAKKEKWQSDLNAIDNHVKSESIDKLVDAENSDYSKSNHS